MIDLDAWERRGQRVTLAGRSIFFVEEGKGDPLLLIHGFPTASWDWTALWPGLTPRFRVIALDMLGFGFSDKPRRHAYTLVEQAGFHAALLAHLGVGEAHILAHDYGVSVAQELLARHNEGSLGFAIRSIGFLNGGLFPESHRPLLTQKLLASPLGPLVSRVMNERRLARGLSSVFGRATRPSAAEMHAFWRLIARNDGHRIAHRLIAYMEERRQQRARWVGALTTTSVPLRLINGAADPVSGAHVAARYRELVPRPDVVLLDGIGHYPQVEAPERVLDAFLAFVPRGPGA